MKALIFGQTGQVALELARQVPVGIEAVQLGRAEADLSDPAGCAKAVRDHAPDVVINAAAYTAVDRAEEEEALATVINGEAPGAMAQACAALAIPFVHVSTDYVFEGGGTAPWQPLDDTAPQNAYGRSKLAGEIAVRNAGGVHVILRTSWVFSSHGNNFVKTMKRLGETRDALNVVADQIGGPTPAAGIASTLWSIAQVLPAKPDAAGTYHYSGAPDASWAGFAAEIFAQTKQAVAVTGIPASDYPTPASRPANSRMDCTSLYEAFGIARPDWRDALATVLAELADQNA